MKARIETVSAITLKVAQIEESVRFYQGVLGLEIVYGGPSATFTSLRIPDAKSPLINLQLGRPTTDWGRIIFHVSDADAFSSHSRPRWSRAVVCTTVVTKESIHDLST